MGDFGGEGVWQKKIPRVSLYPWRRITSELQEWLTIFQKEVRISK